MEHMSGLASIMPNLFQIKQVGFKLFFNAPIFTRIVSQPFSHTVPFCLVSLQLILNTDFWVECSKAFEHVAPTISSLEGNHAFRSTSTRTTILLGCRLDFNFTSVAFLFVMLLFDIHFLFKPFQLHFSCNFDC